MTAACIHGFSWDVACALCNRLGSIQTVLYSTTDTATDLSRKLDEIIRLLKEIEYHVRASR